MRAGEAFKNVAQYLFRDVRRSTDTQVVANHDAQIADSLVHCAVADIKVCKPVGLPNLELGGKCSEAFSAIGGNEPRFGGETTFQFSFRGSGRIRQFDLLVFGNVLGGLECVKMFLVPLADAMEGFKYGRVGSNFAIPKPLLVKARQRESSCKPGAYKRCEGREKREK
jgi:hypothetical protein